MQEIYNHSGELIAYQYQNMLLHPNKWDVLGLVLGNCVYNHQAVALGKFVQHNIYNFSGEVMARKSDASIPVPDQIDLTKSILQGWDILLGIKDYSSPWVETTPKWSNASLAESLYTY